MKRAIVLSTAWLIASAFGAGVASGGVAPVALAAQTPEGTAASAGSSVTATSPWNGWTRLRFRARPLLFFSGEVEMKMSEKNGQRMLETQTRASFLGMELTRARSLTTMDARTGRTLDYYTLSSKRGRRYVFGESGYTIEKLLPSNGYEAPIEQWEVRSRKEHPYPAAATPGGPAPVVYDYYGMILHLRDEKLAKPGDEVTMYVATSDGAVPYSVRVGEVRSSEREYTDLATGRKLKTPVREFRLRVAPADPAAADEGFLKMEGETEIWVEAGTRTLLEVDGKIPKVPGRVEVTLSGKS